MPMLHGDCLDLLPTIRADSIDMVFADLPYGVTANKWDTVIPFEPLWHELLRVGKEKCAFIFTATQPFATALINSQPKLFRYDLVWQRRNPTGFLQAKKQPLRNFENLLIFYARQPNYTPQMTHGHRPYKKTPTLTTGGNNLANAKLVTKHVVNDGSRYPTGIIDVDASDLRGAWGNSKRLHPTQKPVALLEWLIKTYTLEGHKVLDPTAGSGTTAIAAINTKRQYMCIEKDASYYTIASKRIQERALQPPENEGRQ